jgi:hypothetical protein
VHVLGKALGAFWLGRDTGREPASCTGGRENSVALQALRVTGLCLHVLNVYSTTVWFVAAEVAVNTCFSMVTRVSAVSSVNGIELSHRQLWIDCARVLWEWWAGESETSERTGGDEEQYYYSSTVKRET